MQAIPLGGGSSCCCVHTLWTICLLLNPQPLWGSADSGGHLSYCWSSLGVPSSQSKCGGRAVIPAWKKSLGYLWRSNIVLFKIKSFLPLSSPKLFFSLFDIVQVITAEQHCPTTVTSNVFSCHSRDTSWSTPHLHSPTIQQDVYKLSNTPRGRPFFPSVPNWFLPLTPELSLFLLSSQITVGQTVPMLTAKRQKSLERSFSPAAGTDAPCRGWETKALLWRITAVRAAQAVTSPIPSSERQELTTALTPANALRARQQCPYLTGLGSLHGTPHTHAVQHFTVKICHPLSLSTTGMPRRLNTPSDNIHPCPMAGAEPWSQPVNPPGS